MDEADAVDALKRLGLTTYEARVFVALQKLGTGTASEVAAITDVPRSQVYGAADGLEEQGLLDVQQSNPTRYRPVDVEEARDRLYRQLRSESGAAFDYIESVQEEYGDSTEERASIWTVHGGSSVASRTAELLGTTEDHVMYGVDDVDYLEPSVRDALIAATERGVDITVISANDDVLALGDELGLDTVPVVGHRPELATGRVLNADDKAVLISVEGEQEAAFWSRDTAFASMLATLLTGFATNMAADE